MPIRESLLLTEDKYSKGITCDNNVKYKYIHEIAIKEISNQPGMIIKAITFG